MLHYPNKISSIYSALVAYNKLIPAPFCDYTRAYRQIHKVRTEAVTLCLKHRVCGFFFFFFSTVPGCEVHRKANWIPNVTKISPATNEYCLSSASMCKYFFMVSGCKIPNMLYVRDETTLLSRVVKLCVLIRGNVIYFYEHSEKMNLLH